MYFDSLVCYWWLFVLGEIEETVTKEIKRWKEALILLVSGPLAWAMVLCLGVLGIFAICASVISKNVVKWLEK